MTLLVLLELIVCRAHAVDSDPRSYSNIPVGLNFLIAGYAYTSGSVSASPSIPIKDAELAVHVPILAYSRSLDVYGMSGKVDIIVSTASLSGTAKVLGQPQERNVSGFADPMARFYANFFGAPALSAKEFATYQQDVIVGASLTVQAPGGQYDPNKLVNLGNNRWAFKPEVGLSKAWGSLTAELAGGVYFYTDNNQPFRGQNLQQDPLYTLQGHLIYNFSPGMWVAFDTNYYNGGAIIKDGLTAGDAQENWRVGGTLSFPVHRYHSIKLYGNTWIYSRTGRSFDTIGIAWQYRWGEGL
ncbi:MAG: transporter [Methylobacter sp.]